jgi:hypothetical protein
VPSKKLRADAGVAGAQHAKAKPAQHAITLFMSRLP